MSQDQIATYMLNSDHIFKGVESDQIRLSHIGITARKLGLNKHAAGEFSAKEAGGQGQGRGWQATL